MKIIAVLFVAASMVAIGVCPADAQSTAPRTPAGGLFGATRSDVGAADKLNFRFEVAQGLDSAVPAELSTKLSQGLQSGGPSTVLHASSDYQRDSKHMTLMGNASTAFKYFRDLDRFDATGHSAGLGAIFKTHQGSLRLDQMAAYSPSYLYQLFPVDPAAPVDPAIPINAEYQITDTESFTYKTNAVLTMGSPRATQFTATGSFNRTDFDQATWDRLDLNYYEGVAKIGHRFTPSRALSTGYKYRSGEFGFGGPTQEHGITIGLEYAPALSRTRRAVFRFEIGPSLLQLPESAVARVTDQPADTDLVRLSSDVNIIYPFRLNWRASAGYRRSVEYLSVLGEPALADAARLGLSGLISRRIDVDASAAYAQAGSALRPIEAMETYTGQITLRYALKRWLALSSQYLYYFYDLHEQAVASQLPQRFEQHSVRLGVVLFLETLGR